MGVQVDDVPYDPSKPDASIKLLYSYPLKNVPGFSAISLEVHFPPNGATPPHTHGGASVIAIITKGKAYNKMNDEPCYILSEGESWYEAPGCHHKISANASTTEDVTFVATFVVETKVWEEKGMGGLLFFDPEWAYLQKRMMGGGES